MANNMERTLSLSEEVDYEESYVLGTLVDLVSHFPQ